MNEQEQISQLSALFDGELQSQQAEMVIRRALRDPALRESWSRYALIGACMRGEHVRSGFSVADRVQASLVGERELNLTVLPLRGGFQSGSGLERRSWLGRGALGGAIAAGVAAVSIFIVRAVGPELESPALQAQVSAESVELADVAAPASSTQSGALPGSYTTPGANSPAQRRLADSALGSYLVAHSEDAASALRSSYDLPQGAVELTEDQISALR